WLDGLIGDSGRAEVGGGLDLGLKRIELVINNLILHMEKLGGISWICEELYLGSYCLQRTIVDGVNLFFLCAFYLFLVIAIIGKCSTRSSRKDWVLVLKLSSLGRRRHSTGEIVNYIAVDAYRMGEFPWWFHSSWSFVLQLFLAIGILFWVVGLGALTGLVPLLICGILNVPFANMLQKCQTQWLHMLNAPGWGWECLGVLRLQSFTEKWEKDTRE
ncbi:abc transporter c family member 8, partial [Quercus suber]